MNARISLGRVVGLLLGGGLATAGFAQDSPTSPHPVQVAQEPSRPTQATVVNALATNAPANLASPATSAPGEKLLPANLFVSAWFDEVAKLAQAGIQEDVMLSFVNSAPGTFNLGPEHIIYLQHLGVSSEILNSMLRHDQEINLGQFPVLASTVPTTPSSRAVIFPASSATPGESASTSSTPTTSPRPMNRLTVAHTGGPIVHRLPESTESIVVSSRDEPSFDEEAQFEQQADAPEQTDTLYRVRLPYPVKLTTTIRVFWLPSL